MPILVNGVEIPEDDVRAEMRYHRASSREGARYEAAHVLVVRELLVQEAAKKGLLAKSGPDDRQAIEAGVDLLILREVSIPEADRATCMRYYERHSERFIDKRTGRRLPFERIFDRIRDYLHVRALQTGIGRYIRMLADRANIVGFELRDFEKSAY